MEKLLATLKGDVSSLWKKLVNFWNGEAKPFLTTAEAELFALLKPIFGQFEADELQVAITFIRGVVAAAPTARTPDDWVTLIIQLAEVAGGQTWTVIKGLEANALRALVSLVVLDVTKAAAELAAAKASIQTIQTQAPASLDQAA